MQYGLSMYVFECHYDASYKELSLLFVELAVPRDVISQIAPRQQIHHQVQIVTVLKCILHIH